MPWLTKKIQTIENKTLKYTNKKDRKKGINKQLKVANQDPVQGEPP